MDAIGWSDSLLVGHKKIDADHKRLLETINRLTHAAENGHDKTDCDKEFDSLIALAWEHFALEESLMQAHQDPNASQHTREHAKLIDELIILKAHYDSGEMAIPDNLQEALHKWLTNHIHACDKPLADAIRTSSNTAKTLQSLGQTSRLFGKPGGDGGKG
ncbi:MAG: bacteriohemerythrin [Rhodocyclaceae bacterium]|jgi:hemerythrin-like metal-binding protein|nr:bacteriohemerythrin [Rhodocyclaceae bacterium]